MPSRRATSARVSPSARASPRRCRGDAAPRAGLLEALRPRRGGRAARRRSRPSAGSRRPRRCRRAPISTVSPSSAPSSRSLLLDAEPVEPVGEEADGLVVGEVGLPHPALGLLAAHPPALAGLPDGELRRRRRPRWAGARSGSARRPASRRGRAATISAIANDSSRRPSWLAAETVEHLEPAGLEVLEDDVGEVAAVGYVDLVQRHQPGTVLEAAVRAAARAR